MDHEESHPSSPPHPPTEPTASAEPRRDDRQTAAWQLTLIVALGFLIALSSFAAGILAERVGEQLLLALGTGWVGLGLLGMALSAGYLPLLALSVAGGLGGNVQHPVASAVVSRAYDGGRRATAIGVLNFAGDIGKVLAPLVVGLAAAFWGWRAGFAVLGAIGALFALVYGLLVPEPSPTGKGISAGNRGVSTADAGPPSTVSTASAAPTATPPQQVSRPAENPRTTGWGITSRGAFTSLIGIGILDSAARGTALVFIPFLLQDKGAEAASMSFYFSVLFAAGAAGKFICGPLADRFGSVATIAITELVTAGALLGLLAAPLHLVLLALLPLGVLLNGTSSVLYASVAGVIDASRRARGYGLYYTCSLLSSAAAPILYGLFADRAGLPAALVALAAVTATIVPIVFLVRGHLNER